jgi:hypothetical protein
MNYETQQFFGRYRFNPGHGISERLRFEQYL